MEKNVYDMTPTEIAVLIAENMDKCNDSYIQKNRGHVTASKLKMFEVSPEAYFIKYILEMPLPADEDEDTDGIKLGNAVDYYISNGEMEFFNKYVLQDKKLLKSDLEALCEAEGIDSKGTVPVLEERLWGDKIKITASMSKKFWGVINEWKRQPLFDYDGDYEKQKVVTAKFENLSLKVTLDRLGVKQGLLRDMKTVGPELKKFAFQVQDFGYDFSMSFYSIICKLAYDKDFKVILDAGRTNAPFPSVSLVVPPEMILQVSNTRIIPALKQLSEMTAKWEKSKDPKVWLEGKKGFRDDLFSLDAYSKMQTTLQTEFEYLQ